MELRETEVNRLERNTEQSSVQTEDLTATCLNRILHLCIRSGVRFVLYTNVFLKYFVFPFAIDNVSSVGDIRG